MLSDVTGSFLHWIPALPLLTGVLHGVMIGLLRRRLSLRAVGTISTASRAGALLFSILAFWELIAQDDNAPLLDHVGTWIGVGVAPGVFTVDVAFRFDVLSAVFCLVVAGVGLLVQIYASGFMQLDQRDDRGFQRYFAYTDLFVASMLILVLADNLVLLLLGWVGAGLFSSLLIGFWYGEQPAVRAAMRAFLVGRIGDLALLLGIVLVFWTLAAAGVATLRPAEIEAGVSAFDGASLALPTWLGGGEIAVVAVAGLCFLVAACAQAAQLPFLLWLPGATTAPSPASALVHGACMGAAGVYLLARLSFLYALTPEVAGLMAWIGTATALLAAGLGCVETDIKRVIAYSTAAHLGFMLLGVGAGDPTSAVYHAISHAFFQPVFFMSAGVIILALQQERDLRRMGNVGSRIHLTRLCMWLALLSSIGVPPFWSGYFSREQILVAAHDAAHVPAADVLYVAALLAVGLLAFAMVRLMYLALYGETRFAGDMRAGIEEPGPIMLRPIAILATLCVLGCTIGLPQAWADLFPFEVEDSDSIRRFLSTVLTTSTIEPSPSSWTVSGHAVGLTALGALPAALLYLFRPDVPRRLAARFSRLHELVVNRFYLDTLFERGVVQPILAVSDRVLGGFLDRRLIDGVVVGGTASLLQRFSDRVLKHAEPGTLQLYLAMMLVGGLALVLWLVGGGGGGLMGGAGLGPYVEGHVLSWLIFLPGGTALFLLGVSVALRMFFGASALPGVVWRAIGLGGSGLTLLVALAGMLGQFDPEHVGHQMIERAPWLPGYGIHYFVGVDGISLFLVLLTTLLVPLVLLASWNQIERDRASFVFLVLLLESGLLGALLSLNLLQFYAFAELSFVPIWLIIGLFGGDGRIRASLRLILYSAAGSVVSLVALLVVYRLGFEQTGVWTLDWIGSAATGLPGLIDVRVPIAGEDVAWWRTQPWLLAAFGLSFAIRTPMIPLHTWMPDAHAEAPTAGSVLLSVVMLEVGAYGLVRFALPLFPNAATDSVSLLFALAVLGILHGALICLVERDLKRLVAYACLAQLGLALLGFFSLSLHGLVGGVVQLVSFGLTSAALFLLVGVIEERRRTRDLSELGGLAKPMPVFAAILGLVVMASIGVPLLSGFVGSLLVLVGSFALDARAALGAGVGLVVLAAALLRTFQRVALGPVEKPENRGLIDLDWRERAIFLVLLVPILWIGVHPNPLLRRIEPSVLELMRQMDERRELAPVLPSAEPEPSEDADAEETSAGEPV